MKGCGRFGGCATLTESAWGGFLTLLAVLLVLVATAMVVLELFMPHVKLPVPNRLIGLGCYALAALLTILAIFVIPGASYGGIDVPDSAVDSGHSFGFWVGLILILAGAVLSFMRFQQTGGQLPIGGRGPADTVHPADPVDLVDLVDPAASRRPAVATARRPDPRRRRRRTDPPANALTNGAGTRLACPGTVVFSWQRAVGRIGCDGSETHRLF